MRVRGVVLAGLCVIRHPEKIVCCRVQQRRQLLELHGVNECPPSFVQMTHLPAVHVDVSHNSGLCQALCLSQVADTRTDTLL
jgi:hypothetical protein